MRTMYLFVDIWPFCNIFTDLISFFPYRGRTILDTCPYFTIAAHHWYPTQINGHTFTGSNADTFTLPGTLLEVPALPAESMALSACHKVHFTEYSTEHWFLTNTKASALNDKVKTVNTQHYVLWYFNINILWTQE